jgi:indolepyruvate ferredoxin oxidoreductase beta subunit
VEEGYADIVIAMEMLEGLRAAHFLKPAGTMILNEQTINPMPVAIGKMPYPVEIIPKLRALGLDVHSMDALAIATGAGSNKAVNSVLLGAIAPLTGINRAVWVDIIKKLAPAKYIDVNVEAFDKGYNAIKGTVK